MMPIVYLALFSREPDRRQTCICRFASIGFALRKPRPANPVHARLFLSRKLSALFENAPRAVVVTEMGNKVRQAD
jgi:hypothetical protein